jgi:hypothetical protein
MIYDIESSFRGLRETAQGTFLQEGGRVNRFASSVGRIAGLEGVEFEGMPDPDGFSEAARQGAGLPA